MSTTSESTEAGGSPIEAVTLLAEPSTHEAHAEVGTPESVDSDSEHHQVKSAARAGFSLSTLFSSPKEDEDYLGDGCIMS